MPPARAVALAASLLAVNVAPLVTTAPSPARPPVIGGCQVFPASNPWNQDIAAAPVDPHSAAYIAAIDTGGDDFLHADFGHEPSYGIPYTVVPGSQPFVPVHFTQYGDQSDPGPYPIPPNAPVEAGEDHHVLVLDSGNCHLYELYHATRTSSGWDAGSGAVFDLRSNRLRPNNWTSTDEAGLPVMPGLVKYSEVASGHIDHALRFTVEVTQQAYIHPATHYGDSTDPSYPPMGARLRLRADFDLSGYHGQALVILRALQQYGMYVADTGTSWYISGASNPRFNDDDLDQLKTVPGSAFQVVQTGPIIKPNFG